MYAHQFGGISWVASWQFPPLNNVSILSLWNFDYLDLLDESWNFVVSSLLFFCIFCLYLGRFAQVSSNPSAFRVLIHQSSFLFSVPFLWHPILSWRYNNSSLWWDQWQLLFFCFIWGLVYFPVYRLSFPQAAFCVFGYFSLSHPRCF